MHTPSHRPVTTRARPRPRARTPRFDVAILTGGRGLRLGGADKGQLKVEGLTLIKRLAALAPTPRSVFLVGRPPAGDSEGDFRWVGDVAPGLGAPGGILSAARYARAPWVLVVACDMPRVHRQAVELLLARAGPGVDAVAFADAKRLWPFPALIRAAAFRTLLRVAEPGISARALLRASRLITVPLRELAQVDPRLESLESVNEPQDLVRLRIDIGI